MSNVKIRKRTYFSAGLFDGSNKGSELAIENSMSNTEKKTTSVHHSVF